MAPLHCTRHPCPRQAFRLLFAASLPSRSLSCGKPAWPGADESRPAGEIYADKAAGGYSGRVNRGIGVPRFSMTVHDGKLYYVCRPQPEHPLLHEFRRIGPEAKVGERLFSVRMSVIGAQLSPDGRFVLIEGSIPRKQPWLEASEPNPVG